MSADYRSLLAGELGREALFDEGVEAARNACVAGAPLAAAAITAAAWYDNPLTGVPALLACMDRVSALPFELGDWLVALRPAPHPTTGDAGFTPGFGFVRPTQAAAIVAACRRLAAAASGAPARRCAFFLEHSHAVAAVAGPLNQAGLAALYFADHGAGEDEAERSFLLWRSETAMAQAQLVRRAGVAAFPFFSERYVYDGPRPVARPLDLAELMKEVGL